MKWLNPKATRILQVAKKLQKVMHHCIKIIYEIAQGRSVLSLRGCERTGVHFKQLYCRPFCGVVFFKIIGSCTPQSPFLIH